VKGGRILKGVHGKERKVIGDHLSFLRRDADDQNSIMEKKGKS